MKKFLHIALTCFWLLLCLEDKKGGVLALSGPAQQKVRKGSSLSMISAVEPSVHVPLTYFLAGGLCACISHAAAIPIDVVKTRQQTSQELEKLGFMEVFSKILSENGAKSLMQGTGPTLIGYAIQGSLKYGLYEQLKPLVAMLMADSLHIDQLGGGDATAGAVAAGASTVLDFAISGAMADAVGGVVLTPFEAARIRMISVPEDYGDLGAFESIQKIYGEEGGRSLFIGLPAVLGKQIPYTALSLCTFEVVSKYLYANVLGVGMSIVSNPAVGTALKLNEEVTSNFGDSTLITSAATAAVTMDSVASWQRFLVTFTAAILAGTAGAVVSQPGDTLLSVINKRSKELLQAGATVGRVGGDNDERGRATLASSSSSSSSAQAAFSPIALMVDTAKDLGLRGLFAGFNARLAHVMVIVVIQLLVYDFLKSQIGAVLG